MPPNGALRPLVRGAAKTPVVALRNVSFQVARGEVVGVVGPNGAGKTTLIRVISTLLAPTDGSVTVDGHDGRTAPREVRRRLGLVLEGERGLYHRLTGRANLEFFGVMSGLPPRRARQRARELLEFAGLAERDKLVFGYSSGMRARLGLARALLTDPPLLVLDEPTRSLDPLASEEFLEVLRELSSGGRAILMCSHRLEEVVSVCSRVALLVDGRLRRQASRDDLAGGAAGPAAALNALLAREAAAT